MGLGYSCAPGLARTPLPIPGLRSLCAQSHLWQRCVLGSASSVLASFSGSILCRPGVREAEKSLPTLPAPGPARVHSAAPRVPRGPGRAAPAQVRPGRRGVGTPGVRPSPGPPSAPERRGGGSRPQPAPSQSIWEGHLQIDSLSRPGWSRAAVAEAGGLRCRGSRLRVDVSALKPPGWAERVGGVLSRRSARACCCLHPAEACPSPAFPEPQAAGLGGGVCAPFILAGAFCEVPPPHGPEAGLGRMGSFRPAPGPCDREGCVSIPDPAQPSRGKSPSLSFFLGVPGFPRVCVRPRTGSHHVPPWSWPPKSGPTPAVCLGKPTAHLPPGLKRWSPAMPVTLWCKVRG